MILDEFISNTTLLAVDKQSLASRGFSEETIEKYKFRSSHPINSFVLSELKNSYGMTSLLEEKLYEADDYQQGVYSAQRQVISSNILIPYFDSKGTVKKIRPHKLGFKGIGASVFRTHSVKKKVAICVIAESEFKAVAAECFGFPAIGIPGIASMSGKNWDYFKGELEDINAGEYVICFDTEIKDTIGTGKFIADWRRRYETTLYAYAMAQKMIQAGFKCKIATLPYDWMINGKIDIDKALSLKKTSKEFAKVIADAQEPKVFLSNAPIPTKHRSYINRRVKRFFYKSCLDIKNNSFYNKSHKDKDGNDVPGDRITNCLIKIQNIYEEIGTDSCGLLRDIVITDEYQNESKPVNLKASSMSSRAGFREWLMNNGNYLFFGNETDLTKVWEYIFNTEEANIVFLINKCGYIQEYDCYLFKNVLIKNGKSYFADEQGIFWVDEIGLKPNVVNEEAVIPELKLEGEFDYKKFEELLANTVDYDHAGMAKALMAYIFSILFLQEIQDAFKLFPLFFMYGQRAKGKSTVVRWLTSFFGQQRATMSLMGSSMVGINRGLSYYSHIPFVVDDWRNVPKLQPFIPSFLGIYNRQSGIKGVKGKFGVQITSVRSALMILGEELIPDNALLSRCLSFYYPNERIKECSEEIENMIDQSSLFTYQFMTTKYESAKKEIVKKTKEYFKIFKKDNPSVDARLCINYSILAASYELVVKRDLGLLEFIYSKLCEGQKTMIEGDKLHGFAEEFLVGVAQGEILDHHYCFENNSIWLWLKGICDVMNRYYGRRLADQTTLLFQHFSKQSYFEHASLKSLKLLSGAVPCVKLNLEKMPESLKEIFEGARKSNE